MGKSFCIKTNNKKILDDIEKNLYSINQISISRNQFKCYENIIVHCFTCDTNFLASIISDVIIKFYEKKLLSRIINVNYFYFTDMEKKQILNNALNLLKSDYEYRIDDINESVANYLLENHTLILDGFVNFRLNKYYKILDDLVDLAVSKYLIDREYKEFIKLLNLYVHSRENTIDILHLIYTSRKFSFN